MDFKMKRVLITGANSYVGTSFERYAKEQGAEAYWIDTVDMIGDGWRTASFEGYDTVFHVAGIAHQKETKKNASLYYEINRDLAIEVAKKAKQDGVGQLILMSSMSVYGMETGVITKETQPNPKSHYGRSKWEAEQAIASLEDASFRVCVLRPPIVYGKECKGNFTKIKGMVQRLPIFPYVKNQRSMIYIDHLSAFVRLCIEKGLSGVYFPQNRECVCTMDMAKEMACAMNKRIYCEHLTGLAVRVLRLFHPTAKKAFGSLIYRNTEEFDFSYAPLDLGQSIRESME